MGKPGLLVSLMLGALIAGCVGTEGTNTAAGAGSSVVAGPAEVNETSGAVEGLVIDTESLPIDGAIVALVGSTAPQVATDVAGRFVLNGIAPGTYQLAVAKLGYSSAAKQLDVLAGEVTRSVLTIEKIEVHDAYHRTFVEKGYFECSWTAGSTGPCFFPYVGNNSQVPIDPWTNNRRSFDYGVEAGAVTVFNEMTWDRTTAAMGERMSLFLSYKDRTTSHLYCKVDSVKPVYLRWDRAGFEDGVPIMDNDEPGVCHSSLNPGLPNSEPQTIPIEGQILTTRVNTGPGNVPGSGQSTVVGIAFQQSFEVYISYFFWEYAPLEWTALADA
ncbi:MAG TPA: carboxypeptidase-like regulatory domain-containing protein [Candidatus Thermoplasmatota archaeon]